mgnify:FL=1
MERLIKPSVGLVKSGEASIVISSFTPEQALEREARIQEFLTRAVDDVYPSREALADELRSGKRLTAYLGIDPTAPDMHIGHESQLHKLRRLQELGHRVILLVGDFTARIGDPSDKSAARQRLTHNQVLQNAQSYRDQANKILDLDNPDNPVEMMFNSEWLDQLKFDEIVELAAEFTVQQISQRDMFQRRFEEGKPVYLHEFLYPLMQGWDSVAMDVDIEIGGSDQIFNMLVGRDLMKSHRGKGKFVVAGSLLVDPSGKKMSKTEGNMITLGDRPEAMYHKIMMWSDQIVPRALELCTAISMNEIRAIEAKMMSGELDGLSAKRYLAKTLVTELHSSEDAVIAEASYNAVTQGHVDKEIITIQLETGATIIDALVASGLTTSRGNARRLIEQHGVRIDGETVTNVERVISDNQVLQVGKKTKGSYRRIKTI